MKVDPQKRVAIYAAKAVRGQIIARSLRLCGIAVSLHAHPEAAIAMIEKGEAGLLLVDVNNHLQAESELIRSLVRHLAGRLLITHTDPRDRTTLEALGVDGQNCLGGPLDPEQIYVAVEAFFAAGGAVWNLPRTGFVEKSGAGVSGAAGSAKYSGAPCAPRAAGQEGGGRPRRDG